MEKPARTLAVIMQRRNARSRWAEVIWEPVSVHESGEARGEARLLMRQDDIEQWLHPGFELAIHRDEIEGYYLNVSSGRRACSCCGAWTVKSAAFRCR